MYVIVPERYKREGRNKSEFTIFLYLTAEVEYRYHRTVIVPKKSITVIVIVNDLDLHVARMMH